MKRLIVISPGRTTVNKDNDHLHIVIDNNTEIPDRTDYIKLWRGPKNRNDKVSY